MFAIGLLLGVAGAAMILTDGTDTPHAITSREAYGAMLVYLGLAFMLISLFVLSWRNLP